MASNARELMHTASPVSAGSDRQKLGPAYQVLAAFPLNKTEDLPVARIVFGLRCFRGGGQILRRRPPHSLGPRSRRTHTHPVTEMLPQPSAEAWRT